MNTVLEAKIVTFCLAILFLGTAHPGFAGNRGEGNYIIVGSNMGDGNAYINIAIENVEVDTYEVERGSSINFRVTLHNMGDYGESQVTLRAISGKKVLAEKLVRLDFWDVRDRIQVTMSWDTSEIEAGRYPIKLEIPIFGDANEFDNIYRLQDEIVIR